MAAYYSFIVAVHDEMVHLPEYLLVLGGGTNVFTLLVEDITEFRSRLSDLGVEVIQANRLDETDPDGWHDVPFLAGVSEGHGHPQTQEPSHLYTEVSRPDGEDEA